MCNSCQYIDRTDEFEQLSGGKRGTRKFSDYAYAAYDRLANGTSIVNSPVSDTTFLIVTHNETSWLTTEGKVREYQVLACFDVSHNKPTHILASIMSEYEVAQRIPGYKRQADYLPVYEIEPPRQVASKPDYYDID